MRIKNPFKKLSKFERFLYLGSLFLITFSFLLTKEKDILSLSASLIGATALIFVAKGYVLGQVLTVIFSIFYGIISLHFKYYGEMITYLAMTTPIAILSVISWAKHPFKNSDEVEVGVLSKKLKIILIFTAPAVTLIFYFILKFLGNESLLLSTLSITTSYTASYLTLFRSPYYAIAYACNDLVLITLWIIAAFHSPSCFPMVLCFITFLLNDIYGFYNWTKMQKHQQPS